MEPTDENDVWLITNVRLRLLTRMAILISKNPSLCWELADFYYQEQDGFTVTSVQYLWLRIYAKIKNMFVSGRPTDPKFLLWFPRSYFHCIKLIIEVNLLNMLNGFMLQLNTIIQLLALFKLILYVNYKNRGSIPRNACVSCETYLLWNHLFSWGPIFVDSCKWVHSWGRNFVDWVVGLIFFLNAKFEKIFPYKSHGLLLKNIENPHAIKRRVLCWHKMSKCSYWHTKISFKSLHNYSLVFTLG